MSCVLLCGGSVRALGTAAVDMCQVAVGGADAYYHIGMHCWDIAASAIIVQEAGGVVTDTNGLQVCVSWRHSLAAAQWVCCFPEWSACFSTGSDFDMMSRRVIAASSAAVAQSIAKVVQAFPCRRDDLEPSSACAWERTGVGQVTRSEEKSWLLVGNEVILKTLIKGWSLHVDSVVLMH